MDFLTDLGKKLSHSAKNVTKKSEDLIEITKLHLTIGNEEDKIKKALYEMGSELYRNYLNGTSHGEDFDKACAEIKALEENITRLNEKILTLKGNKACRDCEAIIDYEVNFCPNCGAKAEMPVIEIIEEAAEEGCCGCSGCCEESAACDEEK